MRRHGGGGPPPPPPMCCWWRLACSRPPPPAAGGVWHAAGPLPPLLVAYGVQQSVISGGGWVQLCLWAQRPYPCPILCRILCSDLGGSNWRRAPVRGALPPPRQSTEPCDLPWAVRRRCSSHLLGATGCSPSPAWWRMPTMTAVPAPMRERLPAEGKPTLLEAMGPPAAPRWQLGRALSAGPRPSCTSPGAQEGALPHSRPSCPAAGSP